MYPRSKKDITVQTNLIESRLITGEAKFYQEFLDEINHTLSNPAAIASFFVAKLKEQNNRHAKFNDTAYNLEPNIKESPGGLRDLHMILWIAQSLNMASARPSAANNIWTLLTKQNVISALEARQIQQHQSNLQLLRIRLHFISKRREDRLLFDFQNELADSLGYVNTPRKRASEQLMQSYYRSVKFVSLMNEILLKSFQQMIAINPPIIKSINTHFESHDQLLEAKTAGLLQQHPSAIFEAFLLLQQHPELDGMGATLLRNMQRVKRLVNRDFRQNSANKNYSLRLSRSQAASIMHFAL